MNRKVFIFFILAAFLTVACNDAAKPPVIVKSTPQPANPPAATQSHDHGDDGHDSPRIALADAKKDFDAKTAVFIDTHAPEQFAQRHIPGAINVPANNIEPYLNKIPKGKKIIAYCS
ncbi:MAG TPA: rhodanese-like domain-containing protein [Pyrinomonadaceae bacterium]